MFRVNQKVMCVYRNGGVLGANNGRVFTVQGIRNRCCGGLLLQVHIDGIRTFCSSCGNSNEGEWYAAQHFRPIDDLTAELAQTEVARIIEEKPEHINEPQHA